MKLSRQAAQGYFAKPDPRRAGLLIYGSDAMRVALKRAEAIAGLIGPEGEAEMRLERIAGADLRRDGSLLADAMRAQGFFPGTRVAFVEDATDAVAPAVSAALDEWREGDAVIVVTAGALPARSKLRKAFESHASAYAVGIYDDPPSRAEIAAELARAGLDVPDSAMRDLEALARTLDPGDFRQTVEKIALYKLGDTAPLTGEDILACAPATIEAGVDDMLHIVAEGRAGELAPVMTRLAGQGITPVSLVIRATQHFRALHAAASDPGGPEAGISRLRPPVYGPRRDRLVRQAGRWGLRRLEAALALLTDTDLKLRSAAQRAPDMALVERQLIRLAMMSPR